MAQAEIDDRCLEILQLIRKGLLTVNDLERLGWNYSTAMTRLDHLMENGLIWRAKSRVSSLVGGPKPYDLTARGGRHLKRITGANFSRASDSDPILRFSASGGMIYRVKIEPLKDGPDAPQAE